MRGRRWTGNGGLGGAVAGVVLHGMAAVAWAASPAPERFAGEPVDPVLRRCAELPASVDPRALERLLRESEAQRSDALLVLVDGCLVVDRRTDSAPERFELMSVTKSLVSLAVGLLLDEGRIAGLDAPVSTWLPDWKAEPKARITLRHLLEHTSGLRHEGETRVLDEQRDRLAYARRQPVIATNIGRPSYNNEAVELLSGILEQAAGKPIDRYLAERLFGPLGIERVEWARDRAGHVSTYAGARMRPHDLLRVGRMLLDGGMWQGRRVLSAKWIEESTRSGTAGQGLLWWVRHGQGVRLGEERLAALGRLGAPVDKLRPLVGRLFPTAGAALLEVGALLDESERKTMALLDQQGAPLVDLEGGAPVGYFANGWLGQNLAVYPAAKLVVVRLKRQAGSYDEDENASVGFAHLYSLLDALVPGAGAASIAPGTPRAEPSRSALDESVERAVRRGANGCEVDRAAIDRIAADSTFLALEARLSPVTRNGAPGGIKISHLRPGSLFERGGLMSGDVIEAINGIPVGTADDLRDAVARARPAAEWKVLVGRRGMPVDVSCVVK